MCKEPRKIPAFTLQETLIVLLLSGLLIALVYYALRFLSADVARLQQNGYFEQEMGLLAERLQNDLDASFMTTLVNENHLLMWQEPFSDPALLWLATDTAALRVTMFNRYERADTIVFNLACRFANIQQENTLLGQGIKVYVGHNHAALEEFRSTDTLCLYMPPSTFVNTVRATRHRLNAGNHAY